jgi:hypothetical protein
MYLARKNVNGITIKILKIIWNGINDKSKFINLRKIKLIIKRLLF